MSTYKPLAEKLRPSDLNDFIGQRHLLDSDKPIGKALSDQAASLYDFVGAFGRRQDNPSKNYLRSDGRTF